MTAKGFLLDFSSPPYFLFALLYYSSLFVGESFFVFSRLLLSLLLPAVPADRVRLFQWAYHLAV